MATAAVILAAGRGTRAQTTSPKQYTDLDGYPVIIRTLHAFIKSPDIDAIVVVAPADGVDRTKILLAEHQIKGTVDVVPGGTTRQSSSFSGIERVAFLGRYDTVLIHDAVRPLIQPALISAVIKAIPATGAAVAAIPVTDTMMTGENGSISGIVERKGLYHIQTPQGFDLAAIRVAHRNAMISGEIDATDDVQLAVSNGMKVTIVPGDPTNIKITHNMDLTVAHALLQPKIYD
ncbi:MAG TPA: 2-C-methyl-D-erythritol 4-phosphate cytidylyltransferase [Oligoflexales bacterium]|nr:2-C-methyl-D-erythritol 4-phosphate cytidylyltransferase [Oligoflexales bacterium]